MRIKPETNPVQNVAKIDQIQVPNRGHLLTQDRTCARTLAMWYLDIKASLIRRGFDDEIEWQYSVNPNNLDCETFLKEAAWVVLCSGFRESIVRRIFPAFASAFRGWKDLRWIVDNREECAKNALVAFNSKQKVNAIITAAIHLESTGFESVMRTLRQEGVQSLQILPFIGPITAFHLAKNIGIPVAKPDRHVARLTTLLGFRSANELCSCVSEMVGDPIQVVDLIFWRYAVLRAERSRNSVEELPLLPFRMAA